MKVMVQEETHIFVSQMEDFSKIKFLIDLCIYIQKLNQIFNNQNLYLNQNQFIMFLMDLEEIIM